MKKIILSLLLLLAVSFTATGVFAAPDLSKDETISEYADKKIVFLGDSITLGTGSSFLENRYVNIVAAELGFQTFNNMGVSSTTIGIRSGRTDSLTERAAAVPADADYVVVYGGFNDWQYDVPLADTETGLDTLIQTLEVNTDALIILMTPFKSYRDGLGDYTTVNNEAASLTDYRNVIVAAADQTDDTTPRVQLLDLFNIVGFDASDVNDRAKYTTDGYHPNIAGHRRIADVLISFFKGTNLASNATYTDGYMLNNGSTISLATLSYTGLIPVKEGHTYVAYNKGAGEEAKPNAIVGQFHDANGNFISNILMTPANLYQVFTVPVGATNVIMNVRIEHRSEFFLREILNYESFTITFDSNGGSEVPSQTLEVSNEISIPSSPTKTGFTFAGWFKNENLTTPFDFENQDPLDGDITLYAKWLPSSGGGAPVGGDSASSSTLMYLLLAGVAAAGYYLFFTDKGRKSIGLK